MQAPTPTAPDRPDAVPATGPLCCFYSDSPGDLTADRNVGLLIRHLHVLVHRVIDLRTLPLGLTANQWRPLLLIQHKRIDTPAELARAMNVDTGAMTRMLDRLEAKGFIRRDRIPEDRRVVKITLTDTGHALTDQILPIIAEALNLHLQGFSDDEIRMLLALLKRMIQNGEQVLQQACTPPEP
ncbi:MarR family transcriptional regulator [uncultured Castellaniella sp.]|uniref:MarR family winged helix-turn-helix transcriptional regulator n=1 Tax=uncultured Castellaniella sp. TaxID=647907 RepID=UPI00261164B7|nr:MarR family transcriptional regulator [uncultured Castellaniella sp.]